jgi:hypothetical protein
MPFGLDVPEGVIPVVLGLVFAAWAGIVTLYVLKRLRNNALTT